MKKYASKNQTKGQHMFDKDGYRANVGIILCNEQKQVFWGKRVRENSWQFPQAA